MVLGMCMSPVAHRGANEAGNDVDWRFGAYPDGTLKSFVSLLEFFPWSGGVSFRAAIVNLTERKYWEMVDDRQIILKMPADSDEEIKFDDVDDAIAHIKKAKRAAEKAKEQVRMASVNAKFQKVFGKQRPDIRHFVVLMLENRTFDGIQGDYMNERYKSGQVKRSKWDKDGKDLYSYTNTVQGPNGAVEFPVWTNRLAATDPELMSQDNMGIPAGPAGPVEKFHFLNQCAYEVLRPGPADIKKGPTMNGFAQQYYLKEQANYPEEDDPLYAASQRPGIAATCFKTNHSPAMYVYRKEQMCVLTDIMENFGCSDTHFSSCPCQTWPNRLFAHCATAYGYYNNIPYVQPPGVVQPPGITAGLPTENVPDETSYFQSEEVDKIGTFEKIMGSYDTDTIFDKCDEEGISWGIYHGQISLAIGITKLKYEVENIRDKVHTLEDFADDCLNGELPQFTWIEPVYDPSNPKANDMHPPSNVLWGQKLIKDIYNSLRGNDDIWRHTLFVVTCDEGVGSFDHVKPPAAVDPVVGHDHEYVCQDDGSPDDMAEAYSNPFTRYGTRVPNLMISPYIKPRSVVRPIGHDEGKAPYPFDHTSIIKTCFDLFIADPSVHLTERDKAAPSFVHALESQRCNDGPKQINCPDFDEEATCDRPPHTCHSHKPLEAIMHGEFEEADGLCFKQPHTMASTFQNDLAAFFGV